MENVKNATFSTPNNAGMSEFASENITSYSESQTVGTFNVTELYNNETNASIELGNSNNKDHEVEIAFLLYKITVPIIILFGTVGNLLTFFIMRRGSLKNVSTCFYMSMLALADTGMCRFVCILNIMNLQVETWTSKTAYFSEGSMACT